jgi:sigma-B regulation protein RsbU (phosphoserine phosphatase)
MPRAHASGRQFQVATPLPVPAPVSSLLSRFPQRYDPSHLPALLVDGDPSARALFGEVMAVIGHQVTSASDAEEAARRLAAEPGTRVLLIAIDEPGALELVRRVRRQPGSYIYVVALTRRHDRAEVNLAFAAGADDLLVKPFLIEVLVYRLQVAARIVALEDGLAARNRVLEEADLRYREDLAAAARVQQALLPAQNLDLPGLATAWRYRPSSQLGGDLLNLVPLSARHLAFWVIDASGHGLPPSLLAVQANRFLVPAAGQATLTRRGSLVVPAIEVLEGLNRLFPMDGRTRLYFTVCYGVVDLDSGEIDLACAAHPGPIIVRPDGSWSQVRTRGMAIGWMPPGRAQFSAHRLRLERGDRIYAFSDGLIEANNPAVESFGVEALGGLLAAHCRRPLAEGMAEAEAAVLAWTAGCPPDDLDDLSFLALELTPG